MLEKQRSYLVGTKVCEETSKETKLLIPIEMTQNSMNGQSCDAQSTHQKAIAMESASYQDSIMV
jgi:hypothetical protein